MIDAVVSVGIIDRSHQVYLFTGEMSLKLGSTFDRKLWTASIRLSK